MNDIPNHTPDGHVRCTIIDDRDDVVADTTTRYAFVKDVGIHVAYVVFEKETAFPDNIRGLRPQQISGWTAVVTDSDGELHSGRITDAQALEIRFRK